MSSATRATSADPLLTQPLPERPAYATGMLLDAQDFIDEQTYHRAQLARAMAFVGGAGTLAGLRVRHRPAVPAAAGDPGRPEEIEVEPGLAIDHLGRLIELPRLACLRLQRWWDAALAQLDGDALPDAAYDNPGRFVSQRLRTSANPSLPARAVVADLYLRHVACPRGLSPAFAAGPYDALNAVSVSRLRDAYELLLRPRRALTDALPGLPRPAGDVERAGESAADAAARAALLSDPQGDAQARRDALHDAVLDGYQRSTGQTLVRGPEHADQVDPSAVWIARVLLPVSATGDPFARQGASVWIDNHSRRFVPGAALLARFAGA